MRNTDMPSSARRLAWKRRLYGPIGLAAAFLAGAFLAGSLVALVAGFARPQPAQAPPLAGDSLDLKLILSPGLLTALVQQSIADGESPIPFSHAQVTTADGRLTVRGDIPFAGQLVPSSIDFRPELHSGHLAMQATGAHFLFIPIPANIGALAEGPINRALVGATSGLSATLVSVTAAPDGLEVIARVNPAALSMRRGPVMAAPAGNGRGPARGTPPSS